MCRSSVEASVHIFSSSSPMAPPLFPPSVTWSVFTPTEATECCLYVHGARPSAGAWLPLHTPHLCRKPALPHPPSSGSHGSLTTLQLGWDFRTPPPPWDSDWLDAHSRGCFEFVCATAPSYQTVPPGCSYPTAWVSYPLSTPLHGWSLSLEGRRGYRRPV